MRFRVKKNTVVNGRLCTTGEIVSLAHDPKNETFLEKLEADVKEDEATEKEPVQTSKTSAKAKEKKGASSVKTDVKTATDTADVVHTGTKSSKEAQ